MAILDWFRPRVAPAQVEGPTQAVDAKSRRVADALGTLLAWAQGTHVVNWQTGAGTSGDKALTQYWQAVSPAVTRPTLQAMAEMGAYRTICGRDPAAAFGEPPTILHADPDVAQALYQRASRLGLWALLREQATLADRDGVSGILMITSDHDIPPGEPMGDGEIVRLVPIQRFEMAPAGWEDDLASTRYGQPLAVTVTLDLGGVRRQHRVHGTRVLLLRGQPPVQGESRTQVGDGWDRYGWPLAVWLQEALRALAVELQELVRQMQQLNLLTHTMGEVSQDALLTAEGHTAYTALLQTIRKRMSSASVMGLAPNERLERLGAQLDGLQHLHAAVMQQVSLATGQTEAEITGQPPPGLGQGDKGAKLTFAPRVRAMQGRHEHVARAVLDRLDPRAMDAEIVWRDPLAPTAAERAGIRAQEIAADVALVTAGVITPEHAALRHRDGFLDELPPAPEPDTDEGGGEVRRLIAEIVGGQSAADADSYTPPKAAQENAARVLRWRDEHGDEVRGMTRTGWTRANQLAQGGPLSRETVGRMAAFERHRQNSAIAPEFEGSPWRDAGYVAWLGWGGDEGIAWAQRILRREQAGDAVAPTGSLIALVPDADTVEAIDALRGELAERLPGFTPETWPHVTLLYLGVIPESAHAALTRRVGALLPDVARRVDGAIEVTRIGGFPAGDIGVPVVLHLRGDGLQRAHRDLLAKLAPWVRAEQFPVFRPHLTLGYVPADADLGAIEELGAPRGINAGAAVLRTGERERLTVPMEG